MTDILISHSKDRCYMVAQSEVGKKWIKENIETMNVEFVSIDREFMEEWISKIQKEGLNLEVK